MFGSCSVSCSAAIEKIPKEMLRIKNNISFKNSVNGFFHSHKTQVSRYQEGKVDAAIQTPQACT